MVYVYLPLMVLPLYASMEKLDFRLVEAGYDLYASRLQVLRRIIMPLVKPGIIAGSILVFIPSLGAYVTPRVLGGGKNMMIGNLIELQFGQGRNWPLGAALSITLMVDRDGGAAGLCAQRLEAGARPWLARFAVTRQPGFTTIAIALLRRCSTCRSSRWSSIPSTPATRIAVWEGFSLRWYAAAWHNDAGAGGHDALAGHRRRSPRPSPRWRHHGGARHHAHARPSAGRRSTTPSSTSR